MNRASAAIVAELDVLVRDMGAVEGQGAGDDFDRAEPIEPRARNSQGLAKCEAGLAMHRATGNTRSGLRSGRFVAEVLHRWGNNARAIALGMDQLRELRELGGNKLERGYQY